MKNRSENLAGRGQISPVLQGNSRSIAQKSGEIWTGQANLQPISFKPDRLLGAPDFRSGEIRHAICSHCGEIVRVHVPDLRSREIRLWWPIPLALIIWLAIMWKFGHSLNAPKVEMAAPAPIEASFVELPEAATRRPEAQPRALPRQASKPRTIPRPVAPPRADIPAAPPDAPADPTPAPALAPPTDLMAYVNAARERRRAAEMSAGRENAQASARERAPSADEVRMANIQRNLQPQGTNGVFQIVSMGVRSAKYSFRGWTANSSNSRRELIEVDAGPNGDVERAIVRSMITLIRKYYKGNFNWESQRLERVIVLSARLEDNEGLEDFLMREFFGTAPKPYGAASRNGAQ
ncbi:MAG: hypothetical protein Q8N54_02460 [Sulfurimicrobium sp.]|nr:hypothetical protein [Sulfurimicrobium sp.]